MRLVSFTAAALLAIAATRAGAQAYQSTAGNAFSNFIPFGPDGTPGRPVPGDRLGNQITLAGATRLIDEVDVVFGLNNTLGVNPPAATDVYTADLYLNDGAGGAPGTRFATSSLSLTNPGGTFVIGHFPFEALAPASLSFTVVTRSTHPTNTANAMAGVTGPYNAGAAPQIGSAVNTVWYNTNPAATTWVSNSTWAIADGAATNYFTMQVNASPAVVYENGAVNNVSTPATDRVRIQSGTTVNFAAGAGVTAAPGASQRSTAVTVSDTSHASVASNLNSTLSTIPSGVVATVSALTAADQSVVNVSGGTDTATAISGGNATNTVAAVTARGTSSVTIQAGTFKGFISSGGFCVNTASGLDASEGSTVSILGGTFNGEISAGGGGTDSAAGVRASGSASVSIRGGGFSGTSFTGEALALLALDNSHITLFGTGFNFPYGGITPLTGTITGRLQSGQAVSLIFRQANAGAIILAPVPEPAPGAAMALMVWSAALSRRRRRRRHLLTASR